MKETPHTSKKERILFPMNPYFLVERRLGLSVLLVIFGLLCWALIGPLCHLFEVASDRIIPLQILVVAWAICPLLMYASSAFAIIFTANIVIKKKEEFTEIQIADEEPMETAFQKSIWFAEAQYKVITKLWLWMLLAIACWLFAIGAIVVYASSEKPDLLTRCIAVGLIGIALLSSARTRLDMVCMHESPENPRVFRYAVPFGAFAMAIWQTVHTTSEMVDVYFYGASLVLCFLLCIWPDKLSRLLLPR